MTRAITRTGRRWQPATMVQRLANKPKANLDDADGWRQLAHSYEPLRHFDLSAQAYARLLELTPETPDLLTTYAVTLALFDRAAFERQDYAGAIASR